MRLGGWSAKHLVMQKMVRKPQFRQSQQPQEFLVLELSKLRSNKREHLQPSWLGGAGGAAASRRKRDDSSPTEYLSFLDATGRSRPATSPHEELATPWPWLHRHSKQQSTSANGQPQHWALGKQIPIPTLGQPSQPRQKQAGKLASNSRTKGPTDNKPGITTTHSSTEPEGRPQPDHTPAIQQASAAFITKSCKPSKIIGSQCGLKQKTLVAELCSRNGISFKKIFHACLYLQYKRDQLSSTWSALQLPWKGRPDPTNGRLKKSSIFLFMHWSSFGS